MSKIVESKEANFLTALESLEKALKTDKRGEIETAGIIQMFEYTYETSWRLLKARLEDQGIQAASPKKVFTEAYSAKLIDDEKTWLEMIKDRILTTHTYKQDLAKQVLGRIEKNYIKVFQKLR